MGYRSRSRTTASKYHHGQSPGRNVPEAGSRGGRPPISGNTAAHIGPRGAESVQADTATEGGIRMSYYRFVQTAGVTLTPVSVATVKTFEKTSLSNHFGSDPRARLLLPPAFCIWMIESGRVCDKSLQSQSDRKNRTKAKGGNTMSIIKVKYPNMMRGLTQKPARECHRENSGYEIELDPSGHGKARR